MKTLRFASHSVHDTLLLARSLAPFLRRGDTIGFYGQLGSGKTTFIKGLAKGLGFRGSVSSPSFVVLKIYPLKKLRTKKLMHLYHYDLYRLHSQKECEDIGFPDFLDAGICVFEWADKAPSLLPRESLKISLHLKKERDRIISVCGIGKHYETIVREVAKKLNSRS